MTGHGHTHSHGAGLADHRGRLLVVLLITLGVLAAELVGAVVTGSLALLADAGHMLSDVLGLGMALAAAGLAQRPPTPRRTWGYHRAEILGAAAQALLLMGVGVMVLVEGVRRLAEPPDVVPGAMVVFGVVGLLGNVAGLVVLAGARDANLNLRAAFLEVLADALGSIAVIAAALVVGATGWTRADAVASLLIAALIIPRTLLLLRDAVDVLMETAPRGLDVEAVRRRVLALDHVHDVHDLHATQVATGMPVLTAHVVVDDSCFHDGHLGSMLDGVQRCLAGDFGVTHSTIQFEARSHAEHEHHTHA